MNDDDILIKPPPRPRESLRIAVVTETYPPEVNGVALTAAHFVEGLRRRDHDIQVVRPRQSAADHARSDLRYNEVLTHGVPIPRYPGLKMGLPAGRALTRLWTCGRPDLVHIVTEGPLGWSALHTARKLKLPVCTDFRTNFHVYSRHYGVGWLKHPIMAYLRCFHNRTMLTLVPTDWMRRELTMLGFRNVTVVARGVDTGLFNPARRSMELRRQWGVAPTDPVIVHVGRLAPEKNLPLLGAAFEAMRAREPRAKLVLVGDGPARDAFEARHPDAIFSGVRFGEDLATHFASADIFLFPSVTETFGNVTVEAMASRLAIVAYDYAAASAHLRHSHSGLLAHYDDADQFVNLAADLVTRPMHIHELGARARLAAESIEWDRVVQQLESQLRLLVAAAAGRLHSTTLDQSPHVDGVTP